MDVLTTVGVHNVFISGYGMKMPYSVFVDTILPFMKSCPLNILDIGKSFNLPAVRLFKHQVLHRLQGWKCRTFSMLNNLGSGSGGFSLLRSSPEGIIKVTLYSGPLVHELRALMPWCRGYAPTTLFSLRSQFSKLREAAHRLADASISGYRYELRYQSDIPANLESNVLDQITTTIAEAVSVSTLDVSVEDYHLELTYVLERIETSNFFSGRESRAPSADQVALFAFAIHQIGWHCERLSRLLGRGLLVFQGLHSSLLPEMLLAPQSEPQDALAAPHGEVQELPAEPEQATEVSRSFLLLLLILTCRLRRSLNWCGWKEFFVGRDSVLA